MIKSVIIFGPLLLDLVAPDEFLLLELLNSVAGFLEEQTILIDSLKGLV